MLPAEKWTLRLSVLLLEEKSVLGLEAEPTFKAGPVKITAKLRSGHFVLEANDFDSEATALAYASQLMVGLWNLAIDRHISFVPYFEQRRITRAADPEQAGRNLSSQFDLPYTGPVHGLTEEAGITVYRSDEHIRFVSMSGTGYSTSPWALVEQALGEGIRLGATCGPLSSDLETALDLYLAHLSETSIRARFLTLIMALEVLSPVTEKHPVAVALLSDFADRVQAKLDDASDADTRDALQALTREIGFRKETSIRRRVRQLILDIAPLPDSESQEFAREVVHAYDLRGALTHTGHVDDLALGNAYAVALKATKMVLKARLRTD